MSPYLLRLLTANVLRTPADRDRSVEAYLRLNPSNTRAHIGYGTTITGKWCPA